MSQPVKVSDALLRDARVAGEAVERSIAGPNGAGKSTFYEAHLKPAGPRFLNADVLAGELGIDAYQAADYEFIVDATSSLGRDQVVKKVENHWASAWRPAIMAP